jgi:hypothetical protein
MLLDRSEECDRNGMEYYMVLIRYVEFTRLVTSEVSGKIRQTDNKPSDESKKCDVQQDSLLSNASSV